MIATRRRSRWIIAIGRWWWTSVIPILGRWDTGRVVEIGRWWRRTSVISVGWWWRRTIVMAITGRREAIRRHCVTGWRRWTWMTATWSSIPRVEVFGEGIRSLVCIIHMPTTATSTTPS